MHNDMALQLIKLTLFLFAYIQNSLCTTEDKLLGHMLPLGSHRDPDKVEERHDIPSAKEFFEKYVIPSKAVVFRGVVKDAPIFSKWTDEYLVENYPDFELRLEAKTEKEGYVPVGKIGMGRDTMKNFVENYHDTNKYIVSELPTPAWHEMKVPSFMTCGPIRKGMVEIDLWMSGGNTSSLLHKDAFNTLNCLFNGTKEWKLFEYKYESSLYKFYEPGDPKGGFSRINPESVDLKKYPKVATVPWSYTTVEKGDCLYLPKSMYHQVKSYGTMNTAVALLFYRFDNVKPSKESKFTDCPSLPLPLSEIDVDWQYPGKGQMFMGYPELAEIKGNLLGVVAGKRENLHQRIQNAVDLKDFHPLNVKEKAEKLLATLQDGDLNRNITTKYIKELPRSILRKAALLVEPLIPSNTYEYEYFQIAPKELAKLLSILVKKGNGVVQRKAFVDQYQERLWGSEKFGNEFFDDLAGKGAEKVSKEQLIRSFSNAAKKFDKQELDQVKGGNDDEEEEDSEGEEEGGDKQEEDSEGQEEGGDNQEEDSESQEEGGENEEDDEDAYLGRNIDLDDEKDTFTLEDLGKQILEGDFLDSDLSDGEIRGKEVNKRRGEKNDEEEEGKEDGKTEERPQVKPGDLNSGKKDEL